LVGFGLDLLSASCLVASPFCSLGLVLVLLSKVRRMVGHKLVGGVVGGKLCRSMSVALGSCSLLCAGGFSIVGSVASSILWVRCEVWLGLDALGVIWASHSGFGGSVGSSWVLCRRSLPLLLLICTGFYWVWSSELVLIVSLVLGSVSTLRVYWGFVHVVLV